MSNGGIIGPVINPTPFSQSSLTTPFDASGKVYKVESIMVANVDGSSAADVTIDIHTAANGTAGTSYALAATISVPADATLSVIDKTNSFYLMENQSIIGGASANSDLEVVIAYEDIS